MSSSLPRCGVCGHEAADHGDRAIAACSPLRMARGFSDVEGASPTFYTGMPCHCPGYRATDVMPGHSRPVPREWVLRSAGHFYDDED